ncbi:MAG: hypothetical protein EI684_00805 [Candidatus Viridilinea halotolerans]|uniref:Uncharacterized protein n=1 Tax=Candidatus Viridilinea halotolerans TaxID=2491704 RepID=A0A426UBB7_9CHLR|nr:MAG: hypothetical protein EI684_00805 [Candidatus Viridilinea halotolerans]
MHTPHNQAPRRNAWPLLLILGLLVSLFALVPPKPVLAQGVVYVDANATGANNGTSWANAYTNLATTITMVPLNSQIWVAAGTYYPGAARNNSFVMRNDVAIYGGFAGGETLLEQRDWRANVTVLSGDIGVVGNNTDNSFHVVNNTNNSLNATAILDGFTITSGNANGADPDNAGGGIRNQNSSPMLRNLIIHNNNAFQFGGGIYNLTSSPTLVNVVISGNVSGESGGGMSNDTNSSPTLTNVTISGNRTLNTNGGGIENYGGSNPNIRNSIIWGNAGGAFFNTASAPVVNNSIVEDGWVGAGAANLALNPQFIAPVVAGVGAPTAAGNYRLQGISPAINVGSNAFVPGGTTTDLDRNPRTMNTTVDMGAFEWQPVIYVRPGGAGAGGSWQNARDLAAALVNAQAGQELWVATGTYAPGNARADSFVLRNNVALYGGFAGTESLRTERDWATNVVTLTGDIGTPGDVSDNSYHVVLANAVDATAIIDGFTITGGNANVGGSTNRGGGIRNSTGAPTLRNLIVRNNRAILGGGGLYNWAGSPVISNVLLLENQSDGSGGALFNQGGSNPTLTNVTISGNQAYEGGGIYNDNSNPTLTNVLMSGNFASFNGGAIANNNSIPTLTNVTMSGNRAANWAGGIGSWSGGSATVRNSIIWGNIGGSAANIGGGTPAVSYSLVEGGYAGAGNLASDPLFVNPIAAGSAPTTTGDYRLQAASPVMNVGDNTLIPGGIATDLAGNPRIIGATVDMGAYEALPAVLSISRAGANPTNAATVAFTVTFNMPVVGVNAGDFAMILTGGQVGANITSVTGGGTTWLVTVATMAAEGTIGLNLADDDTIQTSAAPPVPLGGAGANNGNFTGQVYDVDRVPPTLTLSAPSLSITNSGPVTYAVSFAGATTATFTNTDVTLNATGSAMGTVAVTGSAPNFIVTISGITGNGTLIISVAAGAAADAVGNLSPAISSAAFIVDNTPPTLNLSAPSTTITNSGPVTYGVTFAGATGYTFDANDVTLNATGTATGTIAVTGSGPAFVAEISAISGNGTLGISVAAGAATDAAGNLAPAAGPSATFAVDNIPPAVAISGPSVLTTSSGPVTYTVTFTDAAAYTFTPASVILNPTGGVTGSVALSGAGPNFVVTISTITGNGTLGISVAAGAATDAAGNPAPAAGPSSLFTVDNAPVAVAIGSPSASLTISGPIAFPITFTDATTISLTAAAVSLNTSDGITGDISVSNGTTANPTITIENLAGDGTFTISITAGVAWNSVNTPNAASGTSSTVTVDNTPPSAPSVTGTTPTNDTTPTWSWTAGSGDGNDTFRYKLNDNEFTSGFTLTTDLLFTPASPLSASSHTLYVQERDAAGNWSASGSFAIVIDTSAPNAPSVSGATPTNNTTPTWSWATGGGGNLTFRYRLDNADLTTGATVTTTTSFTPASALSAGSHTLYVQERNTAGNWSASGSHTILINTTAPTVSLTTAVGNPTNASPIPVTVTFSESVSGFIATDVTLTNATLSDFAGSGASYSFNLIPQGQGLVTATVAAGVATDTAGNLNAASAPLSRLYDTVAPTVTTTTPAAINAANAASYPVNGTCTSGDGDVSVSVGGVTGTTACSAGSFSITLDVSSVADGAAVSVSASQTDAAGNLGTDATSVLKDTIAPTTSISSPSATLTNSGPVTYTVSFANANIHSLTLGQISLQATGTATGSIALSGSGPDYLVTINTISGDGTLRIGVAAGAASDTAGNPSSAAGPSTPFSVDNIAPSAPNVTGTTPTNNTTPTWSWTAQGGGDGTFRYKLNNNDFTSGFTLTTDLLFTPASPLSAGSHTLYVQERDAAGNWSPSGSFAILVDTSIPSAPLVTGTTPTNDTTPTWDWTAQGGGNGTFRYRLNNSDLTTGATVTTTTSFTPATALAEGSHTLYVQERNTAGNWSASGSHAILVDTTSPTVTLSTTLTSPTNTTPIPVVVTFSEPVSGFVAANVTLANATLSAFAGSGASYSFNLIPQSEGLVTASIAVGVATDAAGNLNAASAPLSLDYNTTAPVVTINAPTPINATNAASYTVAGTCSATALDVSVRIGTVLVTAPCNSGNYSANLAVSGEPDGELTIRVEQLDAASNLGYRTATTVKDVVAPTTSISDPSLTLTNSQPVSYTVTFAGADSYSFALGHVTLHATGSATGTLAISGSGPSFTVTISSISGDGTLGLSVAAGAARDAAGNDAVAVGPSAPFTVDNTAPTVSIGAPTLTLINQGPVDFPLTTLDAASVNLTASAVTFTPSAGVSGTVTIINGTSNNPVVRIENLSGDGNFSISLAAGIAQDAAGNSSAAVGPSETVAVDNTAPTVSISDPSAERTNTGPVSYTVSIAGADSYSFGLERVALNATGSATATLAVSGAGPTFTVTLDAITGDGLLGISVAAGAAHDAAGNPALAAGPSSPFSVDNTAPTVSISTSLSNPTDVSPMPFNVTFSEQVFGFTADDLTISNGNASDFAGSGANYSFNLTPQSEGPVTVTLGVNAATDNVGNPNISGASISLVYDARPPSVGLNPLGPINAANASRYTIAGACTNGVGSVTVTVGTFDVEVPCTTGSYSTTLDLRGIPDGNAIAISAHQSNTLGKLGRSEFTAVKDVILPQITINPLGPINASNVARYSVSGTCSAGKGDLALDIGGIQAIVGCTGGVYSHNFNLSSLGDDNPIIVSVSQTDAVGNRDATEFLLLKDVVRPSTSIVSGPSDPTESRTANFIFSGNDGSGNGSGIERFECALNNAAVFQPCASPYTLNNLATGSHTLRVRAVDHAGNVDPNPASHRWTVQIITEPPVLQHVYLPLVVR